MARQSYSKEFKARVALDALKGQKTVGGDSIRVQGPSESGWAMEEESTGRYGGVIRSPKRLKMLMDSWPGLFRRELLPKLPVHSLSKYYELGTGRPTKELYAMMGVTNDQMRGA